MFNTYMLDIAAFFRAKYRAQAAETSVQQAARNLRKQGVPLEIALDILVRA